MNEKGESFDSPVQRAYRYYHRALSAVFDVSRWLQDIKIIAEALLIVICKYNSRVRLFDNA